MGDGMNVKMILSISFLFGLTSSCMADEIPESNKPVELNVLKESLGVWDAEIEVWPQGLDSPSIKFKGVETNRPFGEHRIASDFDSEYMGETMKVHSIVGYDLDRKKMVGTVIDHGPYAAKMSGDYDAKSKSVRWTTEVKSREGKPIVQKTLVTKKSAEERMLVLSVQGKQENEFIEFMRIKFVKRR